MSPQGVKSLAAILETPTDYGLPLDYASLDPDGQKEARLEVLTAWYDPDKPQELCSDPEAFVRAARLFCDYYLKPADCNSHVYYYDDPLHKYEMMRMCALPPKRPTEPSKVALHAPRFSGKTQTICRDMVTMVTVCRPNTIVLVVEINGDRTAEEIEWVSSQVKSNTRIHDDFGEAGELFPEGRKSNKKWNTKRLQFINGSELKGFAFGTGQRGRHPHLLIFDDVEDEDLIAQQGWLDKFNKQIFRKYMGMLGVGGHMLLMGTTQEGDSGLQNALRGIVETEEDYASRDERFDDWHLYSFEQVATLEDGSRVSVWNDRMSVEAFDAAMQTRGADAVLGEYQGRPTTGTALVFDVSDIHHGYMQCTREDSAELFMLDLHTGEAVPWPEWLETLALFGAVDIADSLARENDDSSVCLIGIDPAQTVFVLDVDVRKRRIEKLIEQSLALAGAWGVPKLAFEEAALQSFVIRTASKIAAEMRDRGQDAPMVRPLPNKIQQKTALCLDVLTPLVRGHSIRFKRFMEVACSRDNKMYKAVPCDTARWHNILWKQVRTFTDEGAAGRDDAIDSLQMAVRFSGRTKGVRPAQVHPSTYALAAFERCGVTVEKYNIPSIAWTAEMHAEAQDEYMASLSSEGDRSWEDGIYE